MPKFLLIHAGPTPWDDEDRVSGDHTLPLTDEARAALVHVVDSISEMVTAVYRPRQNEACDEVARMIAHRFRLRPRDSPDLDGWHLGLWQGLRREDVKRRFPTVIQQWEDSPATVVPPEGESFEEAVDRLRDATRDIVRRNRDGVVALALRPMAMQMIAGLLRRESLEAIARGLHLQNLPPVETIDLDQEAVEQLLNA
jgi:broad specificity phosphatase PhoE